ncbi:MAG: ATP-binding protein [Elusimicrobiota bacterium]
MARNITTQPDPKLLRMPSDSSPVLFLAKGRAGKVLFANRGAARFVGRPYSCLFTKSDVAKGVPGKLLARAKRKGRADSPGCELRGDGSRLWSRVTLVALRDDHANLRGFASITEDASETRRLQANLDFSRRIMQAGEDERRRIAKELHDGVANALSAAKLTIQSLEIAEGKSAKATAETAATAAALLGEAIKEIRRITRNLRPPLLDDLGLASALRSLCDDFRIATGARVRFHFASPPARLPGDVELAVYRIAQEAIWNAWKHSRARSLRVTTRCRNGRFVLEVKDDGRGFRVGLRSRAGARGSDGMGLSGMKERASLIGGVLQTESRPNRGTRVRLELPL